MKAYAIVISLLLAIFVYGEPFRASQAVTFACIWSALAIFSYDAIARQRRLKVANARSG